MASRSICPTAGLTKGTVCPSGSSSSTTGSAFYCPFMGMTAALPCYTNDYSVWLLTGQTTCVNPCAPGYTWYYSSSGPMCTYCPAGYDIPAAGSCSLTRVDGEKWSCLDRKFCATAAIADYLSCQLGGPTPCMALPKNLCTDGYNYCDNNVYLTMRYSLGGATNCTPCPTGYDVLLLRAPSCWCLVGLLIQPRR